MSSRVLDWWIPLENQQYEGILYLRPNHWKQCDSAALTESFRKRCRSLGIEAQLPIKAIMFDPQCRLPVIYIVPHWTIFNSMIDSMRIVCNAIGAAIVMNNSMGIRAFFNPEMATLTSEVWQNLDWSTVEYGHHLSMYTSSLAEIFGHLVMLGPMYNYDQKCWTKIVALWLIHEDLMARHFLYRQDESRIIEHMGIPVQHFTGSFKQQMFSETEPGDLFEWNCSNKAQVGTACFYNAGKMSIGMATIGPCVASLSPIPSVPLVSKMFITASHEFTKYNVRPGTKLYRDRMHEHAIGHYVGHVPGTLFAVISLDEADDTIKIELNIDGRIVKVIKDVDDRNLEIYSSAVFKTGSASGTTIGAARSYGSIVDPRLNSVDAFGAAANFLLVERNSHFSTGGDSGGPVYLQDDATDDISLIGIVEGCTEGDIHMTMVSPLFSQVLDKIVQYCLDSKPVVS